MWRPPSLDPEARLLYQLAGVERGAAVPLPAATPFSWERAILLAERERAIPVLHDYVKTVGVKSLTPEQSAHVQRLTMMSAMAMAHLGLRLEELLGALATAGIPVLLLKGAALAVTVYPSFTRRPMMDLDVLVPPDRAREAWQLATTIGWRKTYGEELDPFYEVHHHLPPLEDTRGWNLGLEIHTALFPKDNPFDFGVDEVWRDARPAEVGAHRALVPDHRHMLLHLCTHFAWSNTLREAGWRTFRDIRVLAAAGRIDWDDFAERTRGTPTATCCYWTLRLGASLAGLEVPPSALAALSPPVAEPILRRLEHFYATQLCPPSDWSPPTMLLPKALWSLGIQPRWSGHGASRPWQTSSRFIANDPEAESTPRQGLAARGRQLLREIGALR